MKKLTGIVILLLVIITSASCSNGNSAESEPTVTDIPETESITVKPTEVTVENIKVKKSAKKAVKTPTEKKEKKTTTAPTTKPPTQGKTKPNTHIVVTRPKKGSFSANDLNFVYKKKTLKLNQNVEEIFKWFGDDYAEGDLSDNRMEYEYDDFIITTYKEGKTERVDSIEIIGEGVATTKGAKIGMFASRLKRYYGDANKMTDTEYVFGTGSRTLTFTYEGNIVTGYIFKYSH